MSRRSRKLRAAFSIELTESRLQRMLRNARGNASEAVVRRLERKVDAETARRVEAAQEKAARELARKQEKKEEPARTVSRSAARTACTCRNPRLDRTGKCRRCHQVPASRRKGFWG